ncbi:MAG TPA: TonB-dependent receptor [Steroidobacteraceae bacterium]|nr:TonB-dependent receptor [Steroidobacteraceae bacterium]
MQPVSVRALRVHVTVLTIAGLTLLAGFRSADAQQQPAATTGGLEEILVTAQKREQNPQEIGISLSAITGSDLADLGVATATDITKSMPGVVLTQPNGPSSFSLAIRGVVQNDFADHQESPAAIYVDDVYVSQMIGLAFSTFDIDRVEVLRGPQGTLFGRNATGGLAHFISRRPTDEPSGYTDVTVGERNLFRVEGAFGGAISDGVDGRIAFQSNHYDPLFKNVFGPASDAENGNDWGLRAQLLFKLSGGSQLLLLGRLSRTDVHAGSWEERATKYIGNGVDVFVGPNENVYNTCAGCNASGLPNSGPFTIRDSISGFTRLKGRGLTAEYTSSLPQGTTLTVVADYTALHKDYQEDSDASPVTLFQFFNGSKVDQQSIEARLNGGDKRLNWTAGLYGLRINGKYYEGWQGPSFFTAEEFNNGSNPNGGYVPGAWPYGTAPYWNDFVQAPANAGPYAGGIPSTKSPYELLTKSYAGFAQFEYRFTDLIGLTLGGRVTEDKKDFQFTWFPYVFFPQSTTGNILQLTRPAGVPLTDYSNSRSDSLVSGKAELDFHLAPDVLTYVSYNRGVKGGGYNAPLFPAFIADINGMTFKPETLTSYEVGLKSEFFDHRLRVNGAAYYYDYKDYQALVYVIGLLQQVVNSDATHKGAELELEWAPTESWRFGAGIAYVDAIIKNVLGRCCTASGERINGDFVPGNAPRWTANAMARYTLPVGTGHLAFQVDGNYLSSFWFNLTDLPVVEQGGFGVANVRLNYTPASGKYEVGVSLENLADKHYGTMGFDNTSINGLAQVYPGMPRWFKAHITYHF